MNLGLPKPTGEASRRSIAIAAVIAGLLFWLWPIGIGGKMPVGGDVTSFFLGLMGALSSSLKAGRLPAWNDLWGYGFPGIGESQMGVYYPPHLVLYGTLPTELAYVSSLVLHALWAGLGAWWAARKFGASAAGASLTGFVFAASGFFLIHMPHPWGYTTGSWMPWAWGLAWLTLSSSGVIPAQRLLLLSLVLTLQLLPGHFQIAFLTQTGIILMAAWFLVEPLVRRDAEREVTLVAPVRDRIRRSLALLVGVAVVFPLAALQLWPTARLARMAAAQRDFNYLSGFAATPFHLVGYLAPGLFHRSPLWRPLVWDPFHTSPEELLPYVGLAPLFLAVLAMAREFRRDQSVRALTAVAVVTLFLSLGPYVPGFRLLILLPGFSFFRAPARWSLATSLALAILAGKGLDGCRHWDRPGRSLGWLAAVSVFWVAGTLLILEAALGSGSTGRTPWLSGLFQQAFQARPWANDPGFPAVVALARKPAVLERTDASSRPAGARSFLESRHEIYLRELAASGGLLAGIVVVAGAASLGATRRHRSFLQAGLVGLTIVDLLLLGQHRMVSLGPARPLVEQSPVLAALAREPRGTRIVDGSRNLPMLVGLEPISAYRTLDLPALEPLNARASGSLAEERSADSARRAMRAAGVGVRVLDPTEVARERGRARSDGPGQGEETLDDPCLARWLFGPGWRAEQGSWMSRFRIVHPRVEPARAWFIPLTEVARPAMLDSWAGDVEPVLELFDRARPLELETATPERASVVVNAEVPGWVVITQLADPQWQAGWTDGAGAERPAEILPTFRQRERDGGWQRVKVPGPGRWTLHLAYQARDVREGLVVSAVAWLAWGIALAVLFRRQRRRIE